MKALLKQKVVVSKPIWLVVSSIAFVLMSRTIIIHKSNDIVRIHDLWLLPFQAESYQGATASDLAIGVSMIILFTGVILILAGLTGWIAAAVSGSLNVLIKSQKQENRTTESNTTSG